MVLLCVRACAVSGAEASVREGGADRGVLAAGVLECRCAAEV